MSKEIIPEQILQKIKIAKDKQLKILDLSYSDYSDQEQPLTKIPEKVFELNKIQILDLSGNRLDELPESLGRLSNLTQLNLSGNYITNIPEFLGNLSNLTRLDLSQNQLTNIPEFLGDLSNLTQLDLSINQLTDIPEFLSKLSNLDQLFLNINQLANIPSSLGELFNLTRLDLSQNQLANIPNSLGELFNLTRLDLSQNQLTNIPESIGNLYNLAYLNLSDNQLTSLPKSFGDLSDNTNLYLSNNPLYFPPLEISNRGIKAIKRFFRQLNFMKEYIQQSNEENLDIINSIDTTQKQLSYDKTKEIFKLNSQNDLELAKRNPNLNRIYQQAFSCEKDENFTKAIKHYEHLIDINNYYLKAWEGLERVYRYLGENEKQVSSLEKVQFIRKVIDFETNVEKKITLQQLKLTNLDFFGDTKWIFQPQINILLGKNGYGKSYLLRLIISLLQKNEHVSSQFFDDMLRNSSMKLFIERNRSNVVIHRSKTLFKKSVGKIPVLAIPDVRYIDKSKSTISLFDNEKYSLRQDGGYHFLSEGAFDILIQYFLFRLCQTFFQQGKSFDLPIFQLLHNAVRELADETFQFYEIKNMEGRFQINVITDGNGDKPLPLQKASQGTLSVLSIFGLIYYYLKSVFLDTPEKDLLSKPAIVFIDEVDAHLHPSWQQKIIRLLRKNFPNIQFILTAHSPLVVAGCLEGEVAVLRKGEDGFVIEEFPGDFIGETTANLYRKLFEIEDIDETYLYYETTISANIDNSKRINELESKESLTDEEEMELELLYRDEDYINRVAQKIKEKNAEDYELKILGLEAEIRELKEQLELQQNQNK